MKALVYNFNIPTYLAAKSLGKKFPSFYYGKLAALSLKDLAEPTLPNEDWIKVKPIYAGICGSDLGAIFYKTSPAMTPFNSFPSVLGHEVVGIVTEVGKKVKNIRVGDRISVDPYIGCEVRDHHPLCPACEKGMHSLCRHTGGTEKFGPGMILGFSNELPGAWGESLVLHHSMAIPLPNDISDKIAAIIEPLSVGLHAVLRQPPQHGDHVFVIGGGMIAYSVIAAIRLLDIDCQITSLSLLPYQKELALQLDVDEAYTSRDELESFLLKLPSTTKHKPAIGKDVYRGGFDAIYDCIGSAESIDDALRFAKERGKITLVGCAGHLKNMDWTFIWANELSLLGTHAYSKTESWQGETLSTQQLLLKLIEQKPSYPLEKLITHEFSLDQYKEAIIANVERAKAKSVKTLFRFA